MMSIPGKPWKKVRVTRNINMEFEEAVILCAISHILITCALSRLCEHGKDQDRRAGRIWSGLITACRSVDVANNDNSS